MKLPYNVNNCGNNVILAIDIGSSWCKAAYIDHCGQFLSEGRVPTGLTDTTGKAVLTLHWRAVVQAVQIATSNYSQCAGVAPIPAAINFACRGVLGVAIDHHGQPFMLANNAALLAKHRETSPLAHAPGEIADDLVRYGYGSRQGGFLGWLRVNQPDTWRRIHRVGGLRDWIAWRLTGEWITDPTIGPGQLTWPDEVVADSGLPKQAFAQILCPTEFSGMLLPDTANELGLPPGVPVASGMHDGAAANVGVGAFHSGDVCLTLGTNFSLRAVTVERLLNAFSYVILPDCWAWVDNAPNASIRLDTVAQALSFNGELVGNAHERLGAASRYVPPGCDGFRLPDIPPKDVHSLMIEVQKALASGVPDPVVYRAMIEQVAFEVGWLLTRAQRAGASPTRYFATGGSVRNSLLVSIISAVVGKPVIRCVPDAGLLGAAIAAAVGIGWYPSVEEAVGEIVQPVDTVVPDQDDVRDYHELWSHWISEPNGTES